MIEMLLNREILDTPSLGVGRSLEDANSCQLSLPAMNNSVFPRISSAPPIELWNPIPPVTK